MIKFFTLQDKRHQVPGMAGVLCTVIIFILSGGQLLAQATSSGSPSKLASVGQYVFIDVNGNGKRDGEDSPLPNATVSLFDSSDNLISTKVTNNNGYFLFDSIVVTGEASYFKVKFSNPLSNYIFTSLYAEGSDSSNASVADPSTGFSDIFTLEPGQAKLTLNAGVKPSAGGILPVSINQFTGIYDNGFVHLSWKAIVDANLRHFDVERSMDGTNFRQIGQVISTDEASPNNFTFLDILAEKGSNFYRLAIVDKEGNYTYSKVITIGVEIKGISLMVVYPNPFSKRVQVKIDCVNAEQVNIRILDNGGNVVRSQVANVVKGDNRITITNVDNLPNGIYFLEVITKDRKMRSKLMKQQ